MGIELAQAYVRIRGDSSGLGADLSDVQDQVESSMRSIAAGAASILGAFAAFGKGILTQGLMAAGSFEQTTVEMETMIGSAEEAQDILAKLTRFAVVTPFEMPQLLQVTKGLIQFGERGQQIMDTLKMLGDASGGTALKFSDLGRIFNHIRGAGHLMHFQFRELSMRGILALTDISKYYGITTEAADKMISHGKISFEDFRKILMSLTQAGGRYNNMMEKQSQTLLGLKSTLNDALNITKRMLVQPLVPMAKILESGLIGLADAMSQIVVNGGSIISFAAVGTLALSTLTGVMYGLVFASNLLGISLKKAFLVGGGIATGIIIIGAALGALVGWLAENAAFTDALAKVWENIKAIWNGWVREFDKFMYVNRDVIEEIRTLWGEVMDNLSSIIKDLVSGATSGFMSMLPSVEGVMGALKSVVGWIRDILDWLSLMTTNWRLTWELMKVNVAIVLATIGDKFLMIFNTFIAAAAGAGMAIWEIMKGMAENVVVVFTALVRVVTGLFKGLWEGIRTKFKGGDFTEGFQQKWNEELAKIASGGKTIGEMGAAASEAFIKKFTDKMGADSPLKGTIDLLKREADRIREQMKKQRDKARTDASQIGEADLFMLLPPTEKKKAKEAAAAGPPMLDLKAGRYSFTDLGTKIQDAMLKGEGEDVAKQHLDVAKMGLDKQDQLLDATKANKPGGTLK